MQELALSPRADWKIGKKCAAQVEKGEERDGEKIEVRKAFLV